jgi:hypothetical protein
MANVKISILTEFLGKGIKDANKSVKGLESSVKNLGYIFGGGYLGAKVLAFSKTAVKAFAADDKAAQTLTRTLSNLGLAFEDVRVSNFIAEMERTYGVLDDQLRPAFQQLLTTTGSVSEAQKALKNALDLSAASGVDVVSVAGDLSKAYVGQTRSLAKYGLGLSQAELKGMKFEEVQARINKLFGGQAALVADTYSGKIDKLNVAAAQATETLGKGLVEAISKLGGTGADNIDNVTKSMNDLAKAGSAIINTFADVFQAVVHPIDYLNQDLRGPAYQGAIPSITSELATKVYEDRMKALRKEMALQKQLAAAEKAKAKALKDSATLKKTSAVFDIDQIQIAAALKGRISEEERTRLLLQSALLMGNAEEARRLTIELSKTIGMSQELSNFLRNLPDAKNPFELWSSYLDAIIGKIRTIEIPSAMVNRGQTGFADFGGAAFESPTNPFGTGSYYGATGRDMPSNLNIVVTGGDAITQQLRFDLIGSSASGSASSLNRTTSSF